MHVWANNIVIYRGVIVRKFDMSALDGAFAMNSSGTQERAGSTAKVHEPQMQTPLYGQPVLFSFADVLERVRACYSYLLFKVIYIASSPFCARAVFKFEFP